MSAVTIYVSKYFECACVEQEIRRENTAVKPASRRFAFKSKLTGMPSTRSTINDNAKPVFAEVGNCDESPILQGGTEKPLQF